jgi:hypothetical protein
MQVHDSGLSIITNYGRAASQKREGLLSILPRIVPGGYR